MREHTPEVVAALNRVRDAGDALEAAKRERDQAIREATILGATRRAVAEAAGVTYARVQQIVTGE